MTLNPYFLNGSRGEQGLVQDLINELIRMGGQDVIYLPRKIITEKNIIKEILVSKFDSGFSIEAYVLNYDGFAGQGDILSKFGVRTTDEITFVISKERYEQLITPFVKSYPDVKLKTRPQEGDLIYLPIDNGLFEVKYVEVKRQFYQLNKLYTYELKCELFEYEDEYIDTGIMDVDASVKDFGYIQTLTMTTSGATNSELSVGLSTTSNTKSVQYVDIINGGYGYKSIPKVQIESPPIGGKIATAVATLKTIGNQSTVDKILILDPGYGYINPPEIKVTSNSGNGFIGTCILNTGVLGVVSIVNPGSEYSSAPQISISAPPNGGTQAEAISLITSTGIVTSIRYENAGSGYITAPTIEIEGSVGVSTGTYVFNELVYGEITNTKAYVKDWDYSTRILKLSIIDGSFAEGESIIGQNATYKVYSIETDDINNPYASNKEIEVQADEIIDFTDKNPFGNF
jgi:hypothetical protein